MIDLWDSVLETAEQQRAKGLAKYGQPVTADAAVDWLQHAIEEQLDSAVYMQAAKQVIEDLKKKLDTANANAEAANLFYIEQVQLREGAVQAVQQLLDDSEDIARSRKFAMDAAASEIRGLKQQVEAYEKELQFSETHRELNALAALQSKEQVGLREEALRSVDQQLKAANADLLRLVEEKQELLANWGAAQEQWEADSSRLRQEVEAAETLNTLIRNRLRQEERVNAWSYWIGFGCASVLALLFRFGP